jgi:hypothetical protein
MRNKIHTTFSAFKYICVPAFVLKTLTDYCILC